MGKLKSYMMDVQETVCNYIDLEEVITESDTCQEAQNKALSMLQHIQAFTSFEMDIAKDYVAECWNEYWSQYV